MDSNIKRPRGGQPGNHNARKHGFYSRAFKNPDRSNFDDAARVSGLDQEISLLRAQLKIVIQRDPDNARLIALIASTLARLMRTNVKLPRNDKLDMKIACLSVYADAKGLTLEEYVDAIWERFQCQDPRILGDLKNPFVMGANPFDYSKK
jgi:hypothetical protein